METWFMKSVVATLSVTPTFIAIPLFKHRFGVDPLIFMVWYFLGASAGIMVYCTAAGRAAELLPPILPLATIVAIGLVCGAAANGSLFQAVGLAPNPGLPPVIYATSSMIVFALSILLATTLPGLFKPVSFDLGRLAGIVLVLFGLYLLAGGKLRVPLAPA